MAYDNFYRSRPRRSRDLDRNERYGSQGYGRGYGRETMNRSRDHDVDYDRDDRDFFDRASDEVRSWFGDDRAEARRQMDERRGYSGRGYVNREYGFEQGLLDTDDEGYTRAYDQRDYRRSSDYNRDNLDWRDTSNRSRDYDRLDRNDRDFDRAYGQRRSGRPMNQQAGFSSGYDSDYDNWRSRQIDELDRDYREWRTENRKRFDNEFNSWRETRQQKRQMMRQIPDHAEVIGCDGEHVGTVDKVRGDRLILTKSDSDDGQHHSLKCGCLDQIEDGKVKLEITADDARNQWREEEQVMELDQNQQISSRSYESSY